MKNVLLILVTVLAWSQRSAAAQETDTTTVLAPVVVTATRVPTTRSAVASSFSVLDGVELRAQGIRSVHEALRMVTGLSVTQTGSFGGQTSVFVRGGESDYVKVLIDGVPVNAPGGAFDFADLTLDNVERIEVVRGPSSVLYGSDAMTGVVQIFTRGGVTTPRAKVGLRGGTYASWVVDGDLYGGSETVRYGFGFSRSTSDGIYDVNNSYDNLVLTGTVRLLPDVKTRVNLALRYTDAEYQTPTDGAGNVVDQNAFQPRSRIVGSFEATRFFIPAVQGRLALALNDANAGFDDQPDDPADTLGFYAFTSLESVQRRSIDVGANVFLPLASTVTTGVVIEDQSQRSLNESRSEFGSGAGRMDVNRLNVGYYAQWQAEPAAALAVNAGARIDDNEGFGTFFTWRAGATYGLDTGTRVRATAGKGFKEPTFFETSANSPFALGNPDLEPERSLSWDVGVEQSLMNHRVLVTGTYFNQRFQDLIQFNPTPQNAGDPNFVNIAAADASGVEFELRTVPLHGLQVGAAYTYLSTEVVDGGLESQPGDAFAQGERLLRRPTHKFVLNAQYLMGQRGRIGANVDVVGDRDDRDFSTFPATRVALRSYTKVDLVGELGLFVRRGGHPGLTLSLRLENVFDVEYQEVLGFPARGRTVIGGGTVEF